MLAMETIREYRTWIEFRILSALESRVVEYLADVTGVVTQAVRDLGNNLGFTVTLERRYQSVSLDRRNHRCDVHWHGEVDHVWEIDRTLKEISASKLLNAPEPEKMWVLWAKDGDMSALRLMDLEGINIIILSPDIRKLIWDRIIFEKFARMEIHEVLAQKDRFHLAQQRKERSREKEIRSELPP